MNILKKIAAIFIFSLAALLMPLSGKGTVEKSLDLSETTCITNEEQLEIQDFVESSKEAREKFVEEYNEAHPDNQVENTEPIINPIEKQAPRLLKKVVGADNRVKANVNNSPYKQIGYMEMSFKKGNKMVWYVGTGIIIGSNKVLTAGHNLYDKSTRSWANGVIFQPKMNNWVSPTYVTSSKLHVPVGWSSKGDSNYDIGVVTLSKSVSGYGSLKYRVPTVNTTLFSTISGYPGQRPKAGSQWYGNGNALITNQKISYSIDTTKGQSGSPIINNGSIIGVHTLGDSANSGVRITPALKSFIDGVK
ncbi:trypsin-like serine protease [Listeria monocytogenes]|nr:trypsin-like serine protease [Listeria monocytogenes]EAG1248264.1 trypsin-like serine protease [Listeria monocytogenes]ECW8302279.1 trypsin-like serine protease [Listeria monocytogenes]ECW8316666.1 trypsin-like serine protease [Listeria monocytogenes]ELA5094603.1 trypsin-like serine protease [Listeria monocytogenes]